MNERLFLSCVSDEFEKEDARYPGFRSLLAGYLRRADCHVKVQEDFRQAAELDTVEKLAQYVRECKAVVHLPGTQPGAIANKTARESFLANTELLGGKEFLADFPELRAQLGDCADLTYTQWEAFLALHYGVELFVYATEDAGTTQKTHLDRLRLARKFAESFRDDVDLLGKLIGDLRKIIPDIDELKQEIANSRFLRHTAEDFIGREAELAFLDGAWARRINVLSLIAWGGVGKTSLICKWIEQRFIDKDWKDDGAPALWRYFDWSFYDQGTASLDDENANRTGDVGDFFEEALTFFGDPDPNKPGKGRRLAELVRGQHTLLILDGLEPLQAPPGSDQAGQVLDPDLHDLLIALAQRNPGLCLITSRQNVRDLAGMSGRAAESKDVDELPKETAIRLLRNMQITGTDVELASACKRFGFHALSLMLLGRFLFDAHGGDIARIDLVLRPGELHEADELTRGDRKRTAWRVLEVYEQWLQTAEAKPEHVAVLRLVGLFDRPATADCLAELRSGELISGLTEVIHGMKDTKWRILLKQLERAKLIRLRPSERVPGESDIDAHPLVREYFAEQLRKKSLEAFQAAHSRLFDHLCNTTENQPDTLAGLQPLYQAVTHGCLAGRQEEARADVYRDRILRGTEAFSTKQLGASGADLGAVAAFFDEPWSRLSPNLSDADQAWLLSDAAFSLRALGRLNEAIEPMRISLEHYSLAEDWIAAAIVGGNLSELELTLGMLGEAIFDGRRSIKYADRSSGHYTTSSNRSKTADALNQRSEPDSPEHRESHELFQQAERMQIEVQPQFPFLYSVTGARYVDLILCPAERTAWQCRILPLESSDVFASQKVAFAACSEATRRATQTLAWARDYSLSLFTIGFDHLMLARAALFNAILEVKLSGLPSDHPDFGVDVNMFASCIVSAENKTPVSETPSFLLAATELEIALNTLRRAGQAHQLPKAFLTAAMLESLRGEDGLLVALTHLTEAEQIAIRGPMPLFLADIHLTRARIVGSWKGEGGSLQVDAKAELAEARRLIEKHKYGRRIPELEDAEIASETWPV